MSALASAQNSNPAALPGGAVEIAGNGAWTWFNDERAIVHEGYVFSGYVLSDGTYGVTRFDPETGESVEAIISGEYTQVDDHNNPSLTVLPDGTLLAVFSRHGTDSFYAYRRSRVPVPGGTEDWGDIHTVSTNGGNTYANTFVLSTENNRLYNFSRAINYNPTLTLCHDYEDAATTPTDADDPLGWETPQQFIDTGGGKTRPYPRYCSNSEDRIDLIYTDGHPRNENNSIYHLYYEDDAFRDSSGTVVSALADLPLDHDAGARGTVVYPYTGGNIGSTSDPDEAIHGGRAWTWDIHYGADGNPVCVFQVQVDEVTGSGWNHDRIYYYYARWTGTEWQRRFIAQGGRGIYSNEDDYGGGMCLDPSDPRVVYISTNAAAPFDLSSLTDVPLAQNDRYEIWRGVTNDGGLSFDWTPLTENSAADNLRPIMPPEHGRTGALLWFYGTYTTYSNFDTQVIGLFGEPVPGLEE